MRDEKPRPVATLWRRAGQAGNWTRLARASDCQVNPRYELPQHRAVPFDFAAPVVKALIVVGCGGFHLCVERCPFCFRGHGHIGCRIPCCALCASPCALASFTQWPCECDPRQTALERRGAQRAPCGLGDYRLILSRKPAVFAPHHENDARMHALMNHLARLGIATSTDVMEVRPGSYPWWKL
jgi:hypothetical protein